MDNMKNMIVIKDLPSNIIDEAMVILKPNVQVKDMNLAEHKSNKGMKRENSKYPKKYIVNEAQAVIGNYLSDIEKEKNKNKAIAINKKIENKCKRLRVTSILLGILFFISCIMR